MSYFIDVYNYLMPMLIAKININKGLLQVISLSSFYLYTNKNLIKLNKMYEISIQSMQII